MSSGSQTGCLFLCPELQVVDSLSFLFKLRLISSVLFGKVVNSISYNLSGLLNNKFTEVIRRSKIQLVFQEVEWWSWLPGTRDAGNTLMAGFPPILKRSISI